MPDNKWRLKMYTSNKSNSIKDLTIDAMFIALTFVFTFVVNIRLPIFANGGLIHLGNVPLFIGAVLFGKRTGALAGAIGMGLFDLVSGWVLWTPFTVIVVGCMGYVVGTITNNSKNIFRIILSMILAMVIKVAGYYIAEGIIYGNWIAPLNSVPGNIVQVGVALIISVPLISALRRIGEKINKA